MAERRKDVGRKLFQAMKSLKSQSQPCACISLDAWLILLY